MSAAKGKRQQTRFKQVRWTDRGDGLVRKKTTYTHKGPAHPNPGPRPLPRAQHPKAPKAAQAAPHQDKRNARRFPT